MIDTALPVRESWTAVQRAGTATTSSFLNLFTNYSTTIVMFMLP
jgi:hypothetical protein